MMDGHDVVNNMRLDWMGVQCCFIYVNTVIHIHIGDVTTLILIKVTFQFKSLQL